MEIIKAYKYRIYPTVKQQKFLDNCFDTSRFIWNKVNETYNYLYGFGDRVDKKWMDRAVTDYLKSEECAWCSCIPKRALEYVVRDYYDAWDRFFKAHKKGDIQKLRDKKIAEYLKKGQPVKWKVINAIGKPKFKKRTGKQSFRSDRSIYFLHDEMRVKIRGHKIKISKDRKPDGEVKTIAFSKTLTGKYFIAATVRTGVDYPGLKDCVNTVGVDLGVKTFATLSDGSKIDNPKFLKTEQKRIKRLHRKLSKQVKFSNRWNKTKKAIAVIQEKVNNRRSDFLHNVTTGLVENYDGIGIEDLNVKGMTASVKGVKRKNGNGFEQTGKRAKSGLNRSVLDTSFYSFKSMLEYKTRENGKHLVTINRYFPSSKNCSTCGHKNTELTLKIRKWDCAKCGATHDRDINAAKNIENEAFNK